MGALREELHHLVDEIPEDQVAPVLALVRENLTPLQRRSKAVAALEQVRERLSGVTGIDEEIQRLRNSPRG